MATSSNHNEVEQIIYRELQSINEEYDHPFTQKQVDIIVKFISIDYDDRCVRVQPDIASRYFDSIPRFLAFGYLNQLLEKLGQNTPLSMVEKHVDIFSFLIRELKGYFVGAAWLDKMEALVRDNDIYTKELEMTYKNLKEIFNDCLKSIKEEKEKMLGKLQVRKAQLNCSVEEGSDEAFAEYLQNSEMIKGVFEKEINDVEATIMEILPEMKPELGHEAKAKLASLEFDIFSPTIIREKKVITSSTFISDSSARSEKMKRKILTLTSPYQRRRSSVSNSMTTSSSHNEVEEIIYRELQCINDEYDHPFSQKQVDIIVKFISADYDDRCVHVRSDIVSRYFDNISKFLAFGYLNQLLEKLGQNTPLSMVEKHVDIFSFLIRELKGYFVGAAWLDKMEALVRDNEIYAKELETTEKNLKEIFNDCLKSIKEEKEKMLGKLQVRKARLNCSVEEGSDQGFAEYLQNSEMIKGVFVKEINDVEATIMEILPEMKPELGREAKAKLASLEFDIFSPTIIREKKVVTSSKFVSDNALWLENKRRKILTMRRDSSVSNSIATSSSHNEVEEIIYRELQSINDEYVHPFTPNQVDNIVKFISTDYDDRCVRVQPDIASRYLDNIPQFLAFGYLNQLLEKLGQNSPLSMIEKHVYIFSFLIQELKGYFVGAAWLDKMETLVRDNGPYAKELETTEKNLKEIFNDRLKSIKEEKEKMFGELQVRKAQLNCSVEEGSDQAFTEYLQNSEMIKGVFEKEIKDVQATVMKIMSEMKPSLDRGAKAKLGSLEFDIFSPTIIREKKVTRSTSKSSEKAAWLEMLDNY